MDDGFGAETFQLGDLRFVADDGMDCVVGLGKEGRKAAGDFARTAEDED